MIREEPYHNWSWPPNRTDKRNGPGVCTRCGLMYWEWDKTSPCSGQGPRLCGENAYRAERKSDEYHG
jgi:hypothetical protein